MTLLLAGVHSDCVVFAADRRVTANAAVVSETATKVTVLLTDDALVCIGYTGVAATAGFETETWLMDALMAISRESTTSIMGVVEQLTVAATECFQALPGSPKLTLLLAGFWYQDDGAAPCAWRITNWEQGAQASRRFICVQEPFRNVGDIQVAGQASVLTSNELERFSEVLRDATATGFVEAKAHDLVYLASTRSDSVGGSSNTCILPVRRTDLPLSTNYADVMAVAYAANLAVMTQGYGIQAMGGSYTVHSEGMVKFHPFESGRSWQAIPPDSRSIIPLLAAPRSRRNDLCPCGSRQKYKRCHRRNRFTPEFSILGDEAHPNVGLRMRGAIRD